MKDLNMIKRDLMELQKNFNPEKSTYKVFDELIKRDYTTSQIISVLSKIRGVHKYPDSIKAKFVDIINNLNILKDHEERLKEAKRLEEEKIKQQAKTEELKDIIDTLEKAKDEKKLNSKKDSLENASLPKPEAITPIENKVEEKITEKVENVPPLEGLENLEVIDDDGRLMFIILILFVIIAIVIIGFLVLLY